MTRAIESVAGVERVDVSFDKKEATVTATTCSKKLNESIATALEKKGYGGKVVKKEPRS